MLIALNMVPSCGSISSWRAERKSPNSYKLCKQADVLMLFYLFSKEELAALSENL